MAPNDMLLTDILFFINVYAQRWPQTCLDSPTARTMLAQHLAGNLATRDMALAQELVKALVQTDHTLRLAYRAANINDVDSVALRDNDIALRHAREAGVLP